MDGARLPDSINLQLERILSRPPMATSPSLSRLLRFVVSETLAGRGNEITEYQLGVQVFNRGEDFNPRNDPIVRVQTHHLRSRLTHYYAKAEADDTVVIELPPRKYIPVFREIAQPVPIANSGEFASVDGAAVAVAPVVSVAPDPAPASAAPAKSTVRSVAGPIAVGVATVLLMFIGIAMLGRSWHSEARTLRHDPEPVAEDLYVRGRYLLDRQTEPALRESVDCFRQATVRDPQFAAAFAGLADAENILVQYGYVSPREGMDEARRAAKHALALDPNLAEGHVSLAAITEAYDWDFKTAESEYRRAIQLNPELPDAHLWYGMFLRDQNRMPEALSELRRAEQMKPISVMASLNMAFAFRLAGDFNAALERGKRAVELNPDLALADVVLASIYRARSDPDHAEAAITQALRLSTGNPHTLSLVACSFAHNGKRAQSVELLHQMEQMATQRYVSPYDLGNVALMIGDEDRAVNWYEEALRQHSTGMIFLRNEKSELLSRSPRLRSLFAKIG